MKTILLFGAGKSATVLIDYLVAEAPANDWKIIIVDTDRDLILAKTNHSPYAEAVSADITNANERAELVQEADLVISMMPPALHILIASDCLEFEKHLLTASYVDSSIKALADDIAAKELLFIGELGLDPGIDHMSAMKLIDEIKAAGGQIHSFKSHCGGLVAPESDDNPWHYKISWNPRNVVLAGKAGAVYKTDGAVIEEPYETLFRAERGVNTGDEIGFLSYYPNRDSLPYIELYGLQDAATFIRTTLRYPDFMYGWKNLIELHLTDEEKEYETDGMSLAAFFRQHFEKMNFGEWLNQKLQDRLSLAKDLAEKMDQLMEAEEEMGEAMQEDPDAETMKDFTVVDEKGELQTIDIDETKERAASLVAHQLHEANLTLKQLFFLGMDDEETLINKGLCSAADVLQFAMEKKLVLDPNDKDMIVMLHEIGYSLNGEEHEVRSSLIVKGADSLRTAMAKTVGSPLGIAAKLILNGTIQLRGLHIPVRKEIYEPVLSELEKAGIAFTETKM